MTHLATTSYTQCCQPHCIVWGSDAYLAALLAVVAARAAGGNVQCLAQPLVPTGKRLPNGSYTGRLALVAQGPAEMLSAGMLPTDSWKDKLRFLYPHAQDNLCLAVLRAGTVPFHEQLPGAFDAGTWFALLAASAAATAARLLAVTLFQPRTAVAAACALPDATLRTGYALFVGVFNVAQRQPLGALEALLALASVVLSNAFSGLLASFLTAPEARPDTDTLEDVDRLVRRVHGQPAYADLFSSLPPDDVASRLQRKFVATPWLHDSYAAADALLRGEPVALQKYASSILLLTMKKNYTRDGYPLIHQVRECMMAPAYRAFPVRRGSPLLPLLERSLRRAVEAGLQERFETLSYPMYRRYRGISRVLLGVPRPPPGSLAVSHAQAAFWLLLLGLAVATATFTAEIHVGWRRAHAQSVREYGRQVLSVRCLDEVVNQGA